MSQHADFNALLLDAAAVKLADSRRLQTGLICAKRAAGMMPENAAILNNLGNLSLRAQDYGFAERVLRRSIALDPTTYNAHHNLAVVCQQMGRYEEALEHFARSLSLSSHKRPEVTFDLGLTQLTHGDWEQGYRNYEARWEVPTAILIDTDIPLWRGEPVEGKTVWVIADQGHGDTFLAARWLPVLAERGATVLFGVPSTLLDVMQGYPGATEVFDRHELPEADYYIYLMDLPGRLGVTLENIPDDPGHLIRQAKSRKFDLPASGRHKLKVGVVWAGNLGQKDDPKRSMAFAEMLPLMADPDLTFYSFQVGPRAAEIALNGAEPLICDLAPSLKTWGDTAAALLQMDLVITVCTGVAHLAGALGIPTWVVLQYAPYWVWLRDRTDSVFYPSVRLFRQKHIGNWAPQIADVQKALFEFTEQRQASAA